MKKIKGMRKHIAFLCVITMLVTSVQTFPTSAKAAETTNGSNNSTTFSVMSTTDVHGKCWDENVLTDDAVDNSLLKVSTAVQEERAQKGDDNVILIDNGDSFQGTPVSSYSITSGNLPTPMAMAYKYIGYDAFVLGNHEFNYSWDVMQQVYDYMEASDEDLDNDGTPEKSVPVLAANIVYKETKDGVNAGDNVFKPYITKEVSVGSGGSIKVGVLGLENTDCTRWDVEDNYPNMNFADLNNTKYSMAEEINKYVPKMKSEGCEFIIVSYHAGLGTTEGALEFGVNTENQVFRMIKETEGIDMVISGHDHNNSYSNNKYPNKNGEEVVVVNSGGTDLTKTEVTVTEQADGSYQVNIQGQENIALKNYANDENLKTIISDKAKEAKDYVNQSCGTLNDASWDTKTKFYLEQTDTIDLINRAQIAMGTKYLQKKSGNSTDKVDLSCTSAVVYNNYTAKAGDLTMKDIYRFYKYDNSLYILPLTGKQIKEALEFVASERYDCTFSGGEVRFKTINDTFTCPVFYGIDFEYDLSKPKGQRVTISQFKDGTKFEEDKTYNLAINNYHLGNGPFAQYKPSDTIWSQLDDLGGGVVQDLIKEFVESQTDGLEPDRSNWKLTYSGEIPAALARKPVDSFDPVDDSIFTGNYAEAKNVKEAAAISNGEITVIGQVVCTFGNKYNIIEDVINEQVYGYCIYDVNKDDKENIKYKKGDVVAVTGKASIYNGLPEVGSVSKVEVVKSWGEDFTIAPQVVKKVSDLSDDYLNVLVAFQRVPFNNKITDDTGSVDFYSAAKAPDGVNKGDIVDMYAVLSTYNGYQLRNCSSDDYVVYEGTYDPVSDSLAGANTIDKAYTANIGDTITVVGQVTYKYSSSNNAEGAENNIIIQDIVNGEPIGIQVYDKNNYKNYKIGNIIQVTGKVSEYNGVTQVTVADAKDFKDLKVDVAFQPQLVTIKDLGKDYQSELVRIEDVTLGKYNGSGDTPLTDSTGTTNVYRSAPYPDGAQEGSILDIEAICSNNKGTPNLRIGSSFDYITELGAENADPTLLRLPIVETTDVHGFLADVSSGNKDTYQYRMSYISDKVNDLRENGEVLLLDGGDIYQGNPVSNLLEGQSMIAAYDAMEYDAVTLGNHEFDWGVTNLIDPDATMGKYNLSNKVGTISGDSKIPVVCANIYDAKTDKRVNFTKDYVIVEKETTSIDGNKKDAKVAIFGYVDDYSSDIMAEKIAPYKIKEDDLTKLEQEAEKLEQSGEADASILLVHAGASSIANQLTDGTAFDMVLGGHTHSSSSGVTSKGVPYLQTNNQAQAYGYAELCIDPDTSEVTVERSKVNNITGDKTKLYNTEANADDLDANIIKISDTAIEEVAPVMNVELGKIKTSITKTAIDGNKFSSIAGTWVTELMNASTDADVSFTNNGGIRTEIKLEDGKTERMLTAGDVYTIAPFCNTLPTFNISYEKLVEIIEYALTDGSSLGLRMGGAVAYYQDNKVETLIVGNKLIYDKGVYKVNKDSTIKVCTNEYIATSNTPFKGLTSIEQEKGIEAAVDNESFIEALKAEGKKNSGKIHVTTYPTLVEGKWDGTYPEDNNSSSSSSSSSEEEKKDEPKKEEDTPVVTPIPSKKVETVKLDIDQTVKTQVSTKAVSGELKADGYFYNKDGVKITNAIVIDAKGIRYAVDENGKKYSACIITAASGLEYVVNEDGSIITGSFVVTKDNSIYYTTKSTGKIVKDKLITIDKNKYYATKSGKLAVKKMITVKNKKLYAGENGVIAKSKFVTVKNKKYYATKSGVIAVSKIVSVNSKKYYADKNGAIVTSKMVTVDKKKYYAEKSGAIATSKIVTVDKKKYYADKSGAIITSKFATVKGKKYYATKDGSIAVSKLIKVKGKQYYAGKNGEIQRSKWVTVDGKKYYCNKDGVITKTK